MCLLGRMITRFIANIIRIVFKKRWWLLSLVLFVLLTCRYISKYDEYFNHRDDITIRPCYNIVSYSIDTPPEVKSFVLKLNLDWQLQNNVEKHVVRTGKVRKEKAFLTIGIPSIKRIINSTYIMQTLEHLETKVSKENKSRVVCVVFLCDHDHNYNVQVEKKLLEMFPDSLNSGFFQVVRVDQGFYPQLDGIKRTFNDPPERVHWRAKQVSDYIFLFRYCSSLGNYHLQVEDDVECANDFVTSIESYINAVNFKEDLRDFKLLQSEANNLTHSSQLLTETHHNGHHLLKKARWTSLEFSTLGFIGKLFRSGDLEGLAQFLAFYYDEQPVDWLIVYFLKNLGQQQQYLHIPTLFQHFGLKSSFNFHEDNKLKDKFFNGQNFQLTRRQRHLSHGTNPLALLFSNMSQMAEHPLEDFYIPGFQFFFKTRSTPNVGDSIVVVFAKKMKIREVVLDSGLEGKDCLREATLLIGSEYKIVSFKENHVHCINAKMVGRVYNCTSTVAVNAHDAACVVIVVDKPVAGQQVVFTSFVMSVI